MRPARLAAIGALACVAVLFAAVAALAGAAPAAAASSLDAAAVDAFLLAQGSPMAGTGATFVAEGAEHGVDPAFLVAVAGAESSFGLYLYSSGGDEAAFNAFNWFYTAPRSACDFSSFEEAIAAVAAGIAGRLYYGSGLYAVDDIGPRYCPEGTANWLANVTLFTERLGGDPGDTRWTGAGPPTVATPLLTLDGGVRLTAAPRVVGDTVTARFTLLNAGTAPIEVEVVRLAVRDAAGEAHDLCAEGTVTLAPGARRAYSASWTLTALGRWSGWVEVRVGGQRVLLESARAFTLEARLPRDPVLRAWALAEVRLASNP